MSNREELDKENNTIDGRKMSDKIHEKGFTCFVTTVHRFNKQKDRKENRMVCMAYL